MLFNSIEFTLLFLPVVLVIYFILNNYDKNNLSKIFLVIASLYFYAYFDYIYLVLIILSVIMNYFIAELLHSSSYQENRRKLILLLGIIFNLSSLSYFKYYNFFAKNINSIFSVNLPLLKIVLPLGISFFTFQQLSFLIDNYKRKELKYNFLNYCLFVTFFPQLIAGPIVLASEILPQFEDEKNKKINYKNLNKGLYLFSIGLAKKVLIADSISVFANIGFDKMVNLTMIEAWITSLSYTIQLYFDFSGYCDMAIGIAFMFNIILPVNFDSPYKSKNIQEFWKKWHITLGKFLTTYLYIPLGGNRNGELKTLRNLIIVFLVSGIWHGADWMFIIWGLLHGLSILVHRLWKKSGKKLPPLIGWAITFNLVNIFWIFFRARSIEDALKIIFAMFNIRTLKQITKFEYNVLIAENAYFNVYLSLVILIIGILIALILKNSYLKHLKMKYNLMNLLEYILLTLGGLLFMNKVTEFLYFNF